MESVRQADACPICTGVHRQPGRGRGYRLGFFSAVKSESNMSCLLLQACITTIESFKGLSNEGLPAGQPTQILSTLERKATEMRFPVPAQVSVG